MLFSIASKLLHVAFTIVNPSTYCSGKEKGPINIVKAELREIRELARNQRRSSNRSAASKSSTDFSRTRFFGLLKKRTTTGSTGIPGTSKKGAKSFKISKNSIGNPVLSVQNKSDELKKRRQAHVTEQLNLAQVEVIQEKPTTVPIIYLSTADSLEKEKLLPELAKRAGSALKTLIQENKSETLGKIVANPSSLKEATAEKPKNEDTSSGSQNRATETGPQEKAIATSSTEIGSRVKAVETGPKIDAISSCVKSEATETDPSTIPAHKYTTSTEMASMKEKRVDCGFCSQINSLKIKPYQITVTELQRTLGTKDCGHCEQVKYIESATISQPGLETV